MPVKTLRTALAFEKEKFKVPRSAQDAIPIDAIYDDGIFRSGHRFSLTFRASDIDYVAASEAETRRLFFAYGDFLNCLDVTCTVKITIFIRPMDRIAFEQNVLLKYTGDPFDVYRREMNDIMRTKADESNNMERQIFVTVSSVKKDIHEAREFFARVGSEISSRLSGLGSTLERLDGKERLRIFHDFYRLGEEVYYAFDPGKQRRRSHSFKDYVCPDSIRHEPGHMAIGDRFARALVLSDYASYMDDKLIRSLTEATAPMVLSVDVIPVPTDEAVKTVSNKKMGINTNAVRFRRKQEGNADIPFELQQELNEMDEIFEDLTANDKHMMYVLVTLMHTADTLEELNSDTKRLQAKAQEFNCRLRKLTYQQLEGMRTALPFGLIQVRGERTMTTDPAATLIPFRAKDMREARGIYYGTHAISRNIVLLNRLSLKNANGFVFGTSGSGKSFWVKQEIILQRLNGAGDIILIDPENEFSPLVKALGGTVIDLSMSSSTHINALDINMHYGDGAMPVSEKTGFILSMFELFMDRPLTPGERTTIDQCARDVYDSFIQAGCRGKPPTLFDLYERMKKIKGDKQKIAKELLVALEYFTSGTLNIFAHETNVDMSSSLICFNIKDMGSQFRSLGMLVVLDTILNRISRNREQKRRTWIYMDEVHVLFTNPFGMEFLNSMWKRVRKYGAAMTGITQDIDEMLSINECRALVSNSEFVIMLNQHASNMGHFEHMFELSREQEKYITDSDVGTGLIKHGSAIIPVKNRFPSDSELYRLLTTRMEDM